MLKAIYPLGTEVNLQLLMILFKDASLSLSETLRKLDHSNSSINKKIFLSSILILTY